MQINEYTLLLSLIGEDLLSETVPALQSRHRSSVQCHETRGGVLVGLTGA